MFSGVINNINHESIADFGAKRTLGIGGSLMGYIQTGNPYDKNYYHDRVELSNKKKKSNIKNILSTVATVAVSALAGFGLAKLCKGKLPKLSEITKKLPALSKEKVQKETPKISLNLENIRNYISNFKKK